MQGRRRCLEWFGRVTAMGGGLFIVGAVLTMLAFMVWQVAPLARPAQVGPPGSIDLRDAGIDTDAAAIVLAGVDEYRQKAFLLGEDGRLHVVDVASGRVTERVDPLGLGQGASVTAVDYRPQSGRLVAGTSDGRLAEVQVDFPVRYEGGSRRVAFSASAGDILTIDDLRRPLVAVALTEGRAGKVAAAVTEDGRVLVAAREAVRGLFGGGEAALHRHDLTAGVAGRPTALALSPDGRRLLVGTDRGLLYQWDLARPSSPRFVAAVIAVGPRAGETATVAGGAAGAAAVSALGFLLGGESLVVGDELGGVTVWFEIPGAGPGERRLQPVHRLEGHASDVTRVAPSQRNRSFLTADRAGVVKLHHATSSRTVAAAGTGGEPVRALLLAPKGDAQLVLTPTRLLTADVKNPHPEITWRTLFGRVHYEGYAGPGWMWQSTGGSEAFEPKFSLTPLAYGTLKGTFYSLLFALPLGILGAVYTSQFMHPALQRLVKPAVEIMAGLPSVVVGFLAGLWLAPHVARHLPGLVVMGLLLPALVLLAAWVWHSLPARFRDPRLMGWEGVLLLPVLAGGMWLSLRLGTALEAALFAGDFRLWLYEYRGVTYDVRNSIVVGIAMGFAVIPIIFGISEDALAGVPRDLIAGSLALGATPWRTVVGVVVPTALPGIISAVMIGIGRAVGETMIVLMATGNTAVMNLSAFTGFRALSANIAVEMPEAPVGGTLYRVLFASALLLFAFTFTLNTAGELVRLRMQRRVSRL